MLKRLILEILMRETRDWLSQLLQIITVTGEVEIRCAYGAPWRISYEQSPEREIPFHVVLRGTATLENLGDRSSRQIGPGDIVLLPDGSAHLLHDGSGATPSPAHVRETTNFVISENFGSGERLDMLCGRFIVEAPHDRLISQYLPGTLVVRSRKQKFDDNAASATDQLTGLVHLMRLESFESRLGGFAMLNALSSALFTLTLRVASESLQAPTGLLALAGHPRLSPAISAMLQAPAKQWTLPMLAQLCNMSRATFMRHFETVLGRSSTDLLTDIRMSIAANALKNPSLSTESVAELVGYQSIAAFRRAFTQRIGVTPGEWRRTTRQTL
jgi:AraC family transcriptional activator of mtrCDE